MNAGLLNSVIARSDNDEAIPGLSKIGEIALSLTLRAMTHFHENLTALRHECLFELRRHLVYTLSIFAIEDVTGQNQPAEQREADAIRDGREGARGVL